MLQRVLAHLFDNVLPVAADYLAAEQELSTAYGASSQSLPACEAEAKKAKRLAAGVAIATDGLADRTANELGLTNAVRSSSRTTLPSRVIAARRMYRAGAGRCRGLQA